MTPAKKPAPKAVAPKKAAPVEQKIEVNSNDILKSVVRKQAQEIAERDIEIAYRDSVIEQLTNAVKGS